jgi:tetratricopeptide (TPR) repeat protein
VGLPQGIAGYEILEEISRGGQGIVYRVLQKSTKRSVALKVLREGLQASPAARRRFEREIELAAALSHPHIVAIFDSGTALDGRQYFVMDYVRGAPLDRHLAARACALPEKLALFSEICHAVNFAHQRGVIHRDLKPSNILVDAAGHPHILDFGLARAVADAGATALTLTGHVGGTLPYMSPEQAGGLPDAVDVRSDVYALGIILYELLTGTYPYPVEGDTIQVLKHIVETPPTPPSLNRRQASGTVAARAALGRRFCAVWRGRLASSTVDGELETIVLKTLAKERERRYQTAGELARDVEHYLAGEPIEAKRDSHWYLLRKTLYLHRVGATLAAGLVLVILAATVVLAAMYANQVGLRREADQQTELARAAEAQSRERFAQVRDLAKYFVLQFDPMIARLPGAAPARQMLVEKGLAYLDLLARDAAADRELQRELAAAYMTIGDVQGDLSSSNLGSLPAALESYRRALEILESLSAAEPDEPRTPSMVVLTLNKLGDAQRALGDVEGAFRSHARALESSRRRCAADPQNELAARDLASSLERVGSILQLRGDLDGALEHFQAHRRLAEQRAAQHPEDLWALRGLTVSHSKIAGIQYSRHQTTEALSGYRQVLALAERLRVANPENIVARRDVGAAQQWIGIILAEQGEREAALESFREAVATQQDLLRDDPQNETVQTDLATTCIKLGETELAAGHLDAADTAFRRAVELTTAITERRPERAEIHRLRGVACYKMSEWHRAGAADVARPSAERGQHFQCARMWLQRCHETFVDMRTRGILATADAGVPDEIEAEIKQCEAEMERLSASDDR